MTGLLEVLQRYKVLQVLYLDTDYTTPPEQEWLSLIKDKGIKATPAKAGQIINLGTNETMIEVINPAPGSSVPAMDNGIVLRLSDEKISFLLTSDITQEAELDLLTRSYYLKEELSEHGLPDPYPLPGDTSRLDDMNGLMYRDFVTYLPDDILVKVDRASMAVALESREPLIDHKVVEFAASLPSSLKFRNGVSKYLLRKVVYRYVPEKLLDRPKQGFGVPIKQWFKNELKELLVEYLSPERLQREGFLNVAATQKLLHEYLGGRVVRIDRLWFPLMFEMWHERWMGR